ncbi:MAG: glycosyltransferase family 2 protein [Melioribacteraceae bacterium]
MVEISIIIINYNSHYLLEACLRSLFLQTKGINYEVIVVDNGSTESGIEQILLEFPGVKLIKNSSGTGFAAVNNQGFAVAQGKYILMLNNDTVFIEDAITKVANFSGSRNDEAIIGCRLLNEDRSYQVSIVDFDTIPNLFGENLFLYKLFPWNKRLSKYHLNDPALENPIEVDAVKGAFLFVPKSILEKLNNLDERFYFYYEETDLCYRWKSMGGKVLYYPGAEIVHLGGASTDSDHWFKYRNQHISKIQFFQKHFNGVKFLTALGLHELGLLLRFPLYFITGLFKRDSALIKKAGFYLRTIFLYPRRNERVRG